MVYTVGSDNCKKQGVSLDVMAAMVFLRYEGRVGTLSTLMESKVMYKNLQSKAFSLP